MCEESGRPNDKMLQYFFARAKGGTGLLTTGLIPVSHGIDPTVTEVDDLSLFPRIDHARTVFAGWRDLAQGVHAYGSKIFIQITPGLGRVGPPTCVMTKHQIPVSASINPSFYIPQLPCIPLTDANLKKIVMTALFAALACVATMSIRIPTPGTGGYIHPGDAIVILSGVVLGPSYGLLAAGIGSAMSDLLGGYFVYVPITFVIKGLIALFSGLVYHKIAKDSKSRYVAVLLGGVIDIVLVAGGYFICEFFLYGSSAAASIPANIIQGVGGLIISFVLYPVLMAIPDVKQLTYKTK